jgi:branched-chain amino acid transport system substrate-binding protein
MESGRSTDRSCRVASAALAAVLLLLAACGGAAGGGNQPKTVKVAGIWPLSGPFANNGQASLAGAKYAADRINAAGGIKALGGAKIEIASADTGTTAQTAVSTTQNTLRDSSIVASMGSWLSSFSLATTEVSERQQVPWVTDSFSDEMTSRGFRYLFAVDPPSSQLGKLMYDDVAEIAKSGGRPLQSVAVVGDNTAAAVPAQDSLKAELTKNGVKIPVQQRWTPPLADASPVADRIQGAGVDAVLIVGFAFNDVSQLVQQLRSRKVNALIAQLGGQSVLPQWSTMGDAALGMVGVLGVAPLKSSQSVAQAMTKALNLPFVQQDQLTAYLMLQVIAQGLEKAGKADREALRNALATMDVKSGPLADLVASHHVKFDSNGRLQNPVVAAMQWQRTSGGLQPCTIFPTKDGLCKPLPPGQ